MAAPRLRRSLRRTVAAAALALSPLIVTACWETASDDFLRVRNETDRPVDVVVEHVSGEQFVLVDGLRPRREQIVNPPDDPDADAGYLCTPGPVIAFQNGEEVQRFEPPVCYEDGLTLVVDGEP